MKATESNKNQSGLPVAAAAGIVENATMKRLPVKDSNGQVQEGWSFGTFKATQVGVGAPRKIQGWQLRSPDGVVRSSEGNWQQFVPFAQLIISNYGCTANIS